MTVKYSGVQINEQCLIVQTHAAIKTQKYKNFMTDPTNENAMIFARAYWDFMVETEKYLGMLK